jgi:DNA-binding NarL/FixJ family response regulator
MNLEEDYVKTAKRYGLRWTVLRDIAILRCRGFDNLEIAADLHLSRNTVNKYVKMLKTMKAGDFLYLLEGALLSIRGYDES